ncbi:DUF937 domain-containing protein [Spirillospora sp. NPDC047279]|uniref:DUF937 domain-containing protein n=1 Tax=Spirillospora sp. NPDC047279 TaxID=3155478 RepID=UPI0033CFE817
MTGTLQEGVMNELGDDGVQQIAGLLGTDTATAKQAVESALPAIVGGLAKNTEDPQGADDLYSALGDHTGADPANDISALTPAASGMGGAIMNHVLGDKLDPVANAIGGKTGLPADQVKKAALILAPIVMAFIAKNVMNKQGQDAGGVARELQNEKSGGGLGAIGDLLGSLLGGNKAATG